MVEDIPHELDLALYCLGVRVEHQFVGVEAQTPSRIPRAMCPKSVSLTWANTGHVAVETVCGDFWQFDPGFGIVIVERRNSTDCASSARKNGEICARSIQGRAEGIAHAGPHFAMFTPYYRQPGWEFVHRDYQPDWGEGHSRIRSRIDRTRWRTVQSPMLPYRKVPMMGIA